MYVQYVSIKPNTFAQDLVVLVFAFKFLNPYQFSAWSPEQGVDTFQVSDMGPLWPTYSMILPTL